MVMNGQYIENFEMDTSSLIALGIIVLSLFSLVLLSQLFRNLIRKQIDDQMKDMIPIKAIRERIGIRIKLRKYHNNYIYFELVASSFSLFTRFFYITINMSY